TEFLVGLASRDALHADAVCAVAQHLEHDFGWPTETLAVLERALAASPDERLRRLAVSALVGQSQMPSGWDEARRGRLSAFEADPSPLVAASATFAFTREWGYQYG